MDPTSSSENAPVFVTNSLRWDLVLIGAILLIIIATAPRLRVYYRINAIEVTATQILPDGTSLPATLPKQFHRSGRAGGSMSDQLDRTERRIRNYVNQNPKARNYEWIIRYSDNSPDLNKQRRVKMEP